VTCRSNVGGIAEKAGIGRRSLAGDDGEHERIEHCRIGRGIRCRGDRVGRRTGKSLLEMQLQRRELAGREQCIHQLLTPILLQQRCWQPD
jgi:hypothetical protein